MANLSSVSPLDYVKVDSERARVLRVADEVRRIVARYADVDPRAVVATFELDAVREQPAAFDDIVLALEARYDIDIAEDEAAKWTIVADVVAHVAASLRQRRAA